MKKIFTLMVALLSLTALRAEMSLIIDGETVLGDTTFVVSEFEEDIATGEIAMEWSGNVSGYKSVLYVDITRTAGISDKLCIGAECLYGNGAAQETKTYDLAMAPRTGIEAAYFPTAPGRQTIVYTFRGDRTQTVTVHYDYLVSSLQQSRANTTSTKSIRNGQIVILRDGVEYSLLGTRL